MQRQKFDIVCINLLPIQLNLHIMRTIVTAILMTLTVVGASAQNSLSILDLNLTPWGSVDESIIQSQGLIENTNGSGDIEVLVKRITVDTVPGSQNYFCWAQCYEPITSVSPAPLVIGAGQSVDNFYADYKPLGQAGVSTLTYCFYDRMNQADSVCATIRFSASPTGVLDVFKGNESGVSEAYPSPARALTNINYALHQGWRNAELAVYSMLGSKVKTVKLKEDQGTVKLDVTSLPTGMYFYTLAVDGHTVQTRKMLVTK
jgi:hypothetical protein